MHVSLLKVSILSGTLWHSKAQTFSCLAQTIGVLIEPLHVFREGRAFSETRVLPNK